MRRQLGECETFGVRVVKIIRYRGDLGVRVLETEANRPLPVGVGGTASCWRGYS
jgi:hypothetical protein